MDVEQGRDTITNSIMVFSNGQEFNVTRKGELTVVDGEDVKAADVSYSISAANASIDPQLIDGTNILSGDRKLLVAYDESISIQVGDIVNIDGSAWFVVNPQPIMPSGEILCWHPILRKGSGSA